MTYGSMPTNPRDIFREMGLPYSPRSVPQRAVDVPLVSTLPAAAVSQDGDEVNLYSGGTVDRYIFRRTIPGWVRMNDTVNQSIVTALPNGADEGDQIVFDTGTAGVRWHLVYDTSDGTTYPWLFIGGASLYSGVQETGTFQSTTSTSYAALGTAGPAVTLPLAGDYEVGIGCRAYVDSNGISAAMSYDIGGTGAVDADWVVMSEPAGDNTSPRSMGRFKNKAGLTAVTLTAKYKRVGGSGNATFTERWMKVTPVRVG